jgi:hypothetical protein
LFSILSDFIVFHFILREYTPPHFKSTQGDHAQRKASVRLGAKVLAFNVDSAFGNCPDALVLVDLLHVNGKILERLMRKTESVYFRLLHEASPVKNGRQKVPSKGQIQHRVTD